ncbi:MAG: phosphodiester glycosidase family protein [Anaerolineae bacterium]|nr:phosphodiester glycosidase family protein [Anaerolineae bacterium]
MRSKRRIFGGVVLFLFTAVAIGIFILTLFPQIGAKAAKPLRAIIGNEGVGRLETIYFTLQDTARQTQYQAGLAQANAPWEVTAVPLPTQTAPPTSSHTPTPLPSPTATDAPAAGAQAATNTPGAASPTPMATATPSPSATVTPSPTPWTLPPLTPLGTLAGEGVWQSYLFNPAGEVVAVRTFLQPDPARPYALAAIVAFDLRQTRLHYVLGSEEPALPDGPRGHGLMNAAHKAPGYLLATFSGGFMASHGAYGAMADGLTALPAKDGYATITIGAGDGRLQIGEWSNDIPADGNYQSWRQNARLITQNGQITDRVYNGSAATWGSSINGDVVTWRSALGLSADGQILYFAAGPSLSMPALAEAMQTAGAYNSLLLDINETWVHFAAIRADGETLTAEPLLPAGMSTNPDRYLKQSQRDFFYVTIREP